MLLAMPSSSGSPGRPARGGAAFRVVSFDDRIEDADRRAVLRTGAAVVAYEPRDSYLVWATRSQARALRATRRVSAVRPLSVARKLALSHLDLATASPAPVEVTIHRSAEEAARGLLDALGDVSAATPFAGAGLARITATIPGHAIADLAGRPWVMYVSPAPVGFVFEDELGALTTAGSIEAGRPVGDYPAWLEDRGLDGEGVTVAVVDTGIQDLHPDLEGSVVETYNYAGSDGDLYGHGTHVAGIIAGDPSGAGPGFEDPNGFAYGQGVAPAAKLVNQNTFGIGGHTIPNSEDLDGFDVLTTDAWAAGARMWNGSWHTGEGNRVGYVPSARRIDELARDAVGREAGSQQFLFVFSAGNDGEAGPGAPHEAKNIVAVGATHSGRGLHYPSESDIDLVAPFSAVGPTVDGRIFPTVVAPGAWLVSARAPVPGHQPSACLGPAEAIALYCSKSGTSMAAPHVTGAAALIHQWWKKEHRDLPSPAMVKALLVSSADDVAEPDVPNTTEGWGRVDLGALLAGEIETLVDQDVALAAPGRRKSYRVSVTGDRPLKVTLAWTDAPASVGADPVLVNDLDLEVERMDDGKPGETWHGNVFRDGWSATGGSPDRLNNLENVFVASPPPGVYRITVRAANLPGDGVPDRRDPTDQDFALVVTRA